MDKEFESMELKGMWKFYEYLPVLGQAFFWSAIDLLGQRMYNNS